MKPLFNRLPPTANALAALALQHRRRLLPWLLVLLAGVAALLYMKYAMAATFTVTSTADTGGSTCSGTCTLRQAINAANAAGVGPHTINFNIPSCTSGCTITVTASNPLPALTRPVNINGASQPGYSGAPLIRVHGDSYYFLFFFYSVDTGLELATGSSGSTIRGLALTNFQSQGILVSSSNNLIAGNYVGTDLTGNTAVGNNTGIWLSSGSGNTVGGTTAADRNVIAGNMASGVYITSNSNVVVGNHVGVGANGSTALGNAHAGIWLTAAANSNRLGGVNAADANIIANNAEDGITFQAGGSSSGNSILRNAIFNNGQRGIDFNNDGVTANDAGDADSGPNGLQNFPVVSTAVTNGVTTTVTGSLNSNANTNYRIEFFSNATGDGSGNGEGQVYLGTTTVTTNGSGNATYSQQLAVATTVGHRVSAIATVDLGSGNFGSSSEFALNATVALAPAGATASAISGNTTEAGGAATFTVVLDRAPAANVTIPLSSSNTTEGTVSPSSLTFTTANWSTPQTVTVTGQDDTLVDGNRAYTAVLGAATSADSGYNGLNPADVAVTNTDNDTQSTIVVTTTSDVADGTTTSLYALLTNRGADGQISLREAITAANNSANGGGGADRIHFAIALGAAGFTGTNGVNGRWVITLASALPQITDSVIIDATTQTTAVADANPGTLGTGGTVGTDALALGTVNRPEIEILGAASITIAIDIAANNVTLRGFAIRGMGTGGGDVAINVGNNFTGTLIEQNVLGTNAISFTDPGSGQRNWRHIVINGADSGTVQNNLFGFSSSNSLEFGNTSTNWLVSNNEFRDSGFQINGADAIAMGASTAMTLQRNLIAGTSGQAMAAGTSSSNITFVNNTVTGSGTATTGTTPGQTNTIGIRTTASAVTIDRNIITGNYGAAVSVNNGATGVRITQNSIFNNGTITSRNGSAASGQIGIDLNNTTDDSFLGTAPFFTLNDSGDGDAGGNNLQNFPVLATARTNASNQLVLTGSLNSNANSFYRLEFFANTSQHASGYGVGQRYLGALDVATDGSGNATISTTLTANVAVGEFISATATRSVAGYGSFTDTSEFSRTIAAVSSAQAALTVDTNSDVLDGDTASISRLLANKGADGLISLREAITAANNSANGSGGADIINFAVGTGSFSINLGSALPALGQPTVINGWSQPGYTFSPLVIIDCNQLAANGLQLAAGAAGSTVRGLVIRDCSSHALRIEASSNGNTIHGNYLGSYGAAGTDQGVGEQNVGAGIFVAGANNLIGGGGTAQGNVIGGNQSHGVHISGATATGNRVQGNYVGLNAAGTAAVANGADGVRADGSAANTVIGSNLDGSDDTTEGNVVAGNTAIGIAVGGNGTAVQGNYVGLLPNGTTKLANGNYGIDVLAGTTGVTIGGTAIGARNVVSGNGNAGILFEVGSSGSVKGNLVGTDASGTTVITGVGAALFIASSNVQVGGTTAAEGNTFAGASTDGIIVSGASSTGNAILGNRIHSNSGLGIDLGDNGVSANDTGDGDTGPNNLQNAPVLTTAAVNGAGTEVTISGSLNSVANTPFRIEFFANSTADPSGRGEGQRLLGSTNVSTDGSGNASFSALLIASAAVGEHISATATRANASYTVYTDTSEFAANVVAISAGNTVSGTVYEDVNYGGGAGRTLAASSGAGVSGATVELYHPHNGLVASTTTNGSGAYSFTNVANGGYFVRVVQSTVNSSRSGSVGGLLPVLTWRHEASWQTPAAVTNEVGGARPDSADSGAAVALSWTDCAPEGGTCSFTGTRLVRYGASPNFTTRVATGSVTCDNATFGDPAFTLVKTCAVLQPHLHSASSVHVASAAVSGVDFGFNFSTVVNTSNAGTGSLRQAIINANQLANTGLAQSGRTAGIEHLVFMISNGSSAAGLRSSNNFFSGGVAPIAPTSALPTVTDPLVLDAQTQPGWVLAPVLELNGTGAGPGVSGLTLNAAGSVLRGFVINRFNGEGIYSTTGAGLVIQGNYIGTNAAGTAVSANRLSGIWIAQADGGHQIGGTSAAQRNVLSGQTDYRGLAIAGGSGHVVQGNHIGTSADGTAALGNTAQGILVYGAVSNSSIGGTVAGAGNVIRSNGGAGITVLPGATGISVLGNSIHGNADIGIDLNGDGISANDGAKTAGQANLLMDAPVFTTATLSGTTLTLAGHVGSAPSQTAFAAARVEVFVSDGSFANGQGRTFLGFLTADANGNFSGTITGVAGVTNGSTQITGTATDASGNTSEFGPNFTAGLGLGGTVFEDLNYGGGAGRSLASAGGVGLAGATVELYSSAGVWIRSTTTASGGSYSFTSLAAGTYHVRVVGDTVRSQRAGNTAALLGVMTYRTTAATGTAVAVVDQVGGTLPSQADAAAGSSGATFNTSTGVYSAVLTGTAQSFAPVVLSTAAVNGVDFGFNFNTVVNTNNAGRGSLRQALTNANTLSDDATLAVAGRTAGLEHIIFMLADGTTRPGLRNTFASQFAAGIAAIVPTSALPAINSSLVLDAQTQPGWVQDPIVELRGNAAGAVAGLTLSGGAVTVRGLIINRYGSHGISITGGTAQTVQGCWIGTDATGAAAAANGGAGLSVSTTTSVLQIGGTTAAERNVVSGNSSHGMNIYGASSAVLQGNHVGTNAAGTAALGNGQRGVFLDTAVTTATVGGTAPGAGNVLAGNAAEGLWLAGGASTVQGNWVGTNAAGTAALANAHGVRLASGGHLLGGTAAAARNVISGNTQRGVWVAGSGNTVQGNHIGTNAAGSAALPNSDGIYSSGNNTSIGGTTVGAGNLVSGNSAAGVLLDTAADGSSVQGNTIGRNASGLAALANSVGVSLACSNGCSVGGTAAGAGNVISGNSTLGVLVASASQGNAVLGNSVYGNGGIGIDLNNNGVTANDGAKTAGAGNQLMDHPVFTSARARGNQLTVAGYVGSSAGQTAFANARVEIFASDNDAAGFGEGRVYLGSVTTDASGNFSATFTMTQSVLAVGTRLTGTATDGSNNTSEFGANFSGLVVDLVVNHNGDAADATPGDGLCQTATPGRCTLRAAMQEVNALAAQPSALTIAFALPGCTAAGQAACIITPATALPALTRAATIDGQTQAGWTEAPFVELVGSSAPAGTTGLQLQAASSAVRGLVVGGFDVAGITISANNATLQGNVIGLQANGTTARGNGTTADSRGGVLVTAGTGIVIGGSTAAQRNVISGNGGAGIWVDAGTVTVTGNYIGTTAAGTAAAGNGRWGVHIAGGTGHQVGGANTGEGNVVSGHVASATGGIYVAASAVTIRGNRIGTNAAGSGFLPNGDGLGTFASGIDLRSGSGHVVGGSAAGEANVIAGNQGHGIRVTAQTSRISANSIYGNLWRGIDLNADGVTANDGATSGAQPNNGMDHAVVTGAGIDGPGTGITVFGHIGTGSGQAVFSGARVEIFKANSDSSGHGQGATYLGFLTADANGRFYGTLAITLGAAVVGDAITATATDAAGNTSEFGPNWTSTTVAGLSPAAFNAFETDTAPGALTGAIRSKVAGSAATLAVLALDSAGSAPHAGFTGSVQLNWLDARDDSGAYTGTPAGSCRASWLNLGAAGTATFSNSNRVDVALTPPASGTRAMRLQMVYAGPSGTVTACSNDSFAALPAQLAWIAASDATSATAGTTRTLNNTAASGGVVHQAGRPFTLRAQALASGGALMTAYDGNPTLAITGCVLPAGCTAGTLGGGNVAASAGLYTHNTVTYSEVGAVALQLTDNSYGAVDSADTAAGLRTITSSSLPVGRFVPDSYTVTVSTSGVLATANSACLASGSGATFLGQGFGWATAPQVTVTARNAAGATTALWTGSLMKLAPGPGLVPALTVGGAVGASLATSFGAGTVQDLGNGQALLQASTLDRFVLDAGGLLASLAPTWQWQLALTDSSEAGTAGNPQPTATATQASVDFDQGNSFHSARLALATAHGDARSGVRMLMELQRYTSAGWVTMTEDRGCVTVQRSQLEMSSPSGAFVSAGVCASPLASSVTTAGGRAWLQLPASPGGATGRLSVRVAGTAASGNGCSALGAVQPVVPLALPWLTGGAGGAGPQATATWGLPQRDLVLRREIW